MRLVFFNSLFLTVVAFTKNDNFESDIATLFFVFADRRATAWTMTFLEPCSIQKKKKIFPFSESLGRGAGKRQKRSNRKEMGRGQHVVEFQA